MNSVNSFSFEGKGLRVVMQGGEPWWIATEIGEVLGLKGNGFDITKGLEDFEKGAISSRTLGGNQDMVSINESGLYALIFKSRKPEAKRFRVWVTSEVLPSIRKSGGYQVQAFAVPTTFAEALTLAAEQAKALECKEQEIATLEPKAEYHDKVADANGCHSMVEAAQILGTGQNRLFVALRKLGFIIPNSTRPYQTHVNDGLFKVVERVFEDAHGIDRISSKTLITGKGMVAIEKKLRSSGLLIGSRWNGSAA